MVRGMVAGIAVAAVRWRGPRHGAFRRWSLLRPRVCSAIGCSPVNYMYMYDGTIKTLPCVGARPAANRKDCTGAIQIEGVAIGEHPC